MCSHSSVSEDVAADIYLYEISYPAHEFDISETVY